MTNELKQLWGRLLGTIPSDQQFELWSLLHGPEIVRQGILKTAQKNMSVGGTMSDDYKLRFASKVMLVQQARKEEHAENRARLAAEMERRSEVREAR